VGAGVRPVCQSCRVIQEGCLRIKLPSFARPLERGRSRLHYFSWALAMRVLATFLMADTSSAVAVPT
jgi:hypothetical protein